MARKKSKRRDDDEDDDLADSGSAEAARLTEDDDDTDDIVRRRKAKDDAWTGLLAVALAGLVGAGVLFYLDHAALAGQQVAPPSFTLPGLAGSTAPPG